MKHLLSAAVLILLPSCVSAQSTDGEPFSVSVMAAMGRATLDVESGASAAFSSKGLQHLGLRIDRKLTNASVWRASLGHSTRRSQYRTAEAASRSLFDLEVRTTDAGIGAAHRVRESPGWTLSVVAELGRSIIHYASIADAETNERLEDLKTNNGEWSIVPGLEISLLQSRRLWGALSYRWGLSDVIQDSKSRTRVLEMRVGIVARRF